MSRGGLTEEDLKFLLGGRGPPPGGSLCDVGGGADLPPAGVAGGGVAGGPEGPRAAAASAGADDVRRGRSQETALVAVEAFDDLATAEEAADAIDELLARPQDDRRPLWASLVNTLRCRAAIADEAAVPPRSDDWLVRSAASSSRAFGRALAGAWMLAPYRQDQELEASLTPAGRVFSLPGLSRREMASVRGLLQHLEWAVRNDRGVTSSNLLRAEAADEEELGDICQGREALDAVEFQTVRDPGFGKVGEYEANDGYVLVERLLALRERLEDSHGSLSQAFRAMDIQGRGVVSFEHFHAHLVKLRLSRVDAQGSLRALELFKMLDRDRDDLISPTDLYRAMEAAMRHLAAAPALLEARAFAKEQGILDPRFLRDLGGAGDIVSRLHTFRRYIEAVHDGPLEEWLRRLDTDRDGYVEHEDFVRHLLAEGFCVSRTEADELFNALDVLRQDRLAIERLGVMEDWGVFWPSNSSTGPVWQRPLRTQEDFQRAIAQGEPPIGAGGVFSPPMALEGPASPRLAKTRSEGHEAPEVDAIEVAQRLAATPIGQIRHLRGQDDKKVRLEAARKERVAESEARKRQNQAALEAKKAAMQKLKEKIARENSEDDRLWDDERRGVPRRDKAPEEAAGFDLDALLGFSLFGQAGDGGRSQRKAAPKALAAMAGRRAQPEAAGGPQVRQRLAARQARRKGSPGR